MNQKNHDKTKSFSILGDSISTLAGYNPPECAVFYDRENKRLSGVFTPEDTWWGQVIDALDGRLLVNHSWAGSLVCKHPACEIQSYGCSDARTAALGTAEQQPDVIMILMGLNDRGWGMRVTPGGGENGLSVFSVAYAAMLEKLKRSYPEAEIWCLALPQRSKEDPAVRDYNRAIRTCGETAGCRVIDLDHSPVPYDTLDGLHPTAKGMEHIADAVLRQVGKTR